MQQILCLFVVGLLSFATVYPQSNFIHNQTFVKRIPRKVIEGKRKERKETLAADASR